ncbi:MAG: hypothetical protein AAGA99_00495 [Actinomycetota bacterium]
MANPSKAAGTEYENRQRDWYRRWVPRSERAENNSPSRDLNIPTWLFDTNECKRRAKSAWHIVKWSTAAEALYPGRWVLHVTPRDRRPKDAPPDVVVVPLELWGDILEFIHSHHRLDLPDGPLGWRQF